MTLGTLLNLARVAISASILASAALVIDYQNVGDPTFCGAQSACNQVRQSDAGKQIADLLGGMMTLPDAARVIFLVMLAATFFARSKQLVWALTAASGVGSIFAVYLIAAQAKLGVYCAYCVAVDVSTLLTFAVLAPLSFKLWRAHKAGRSDAALAELTPASETPITISWGLVGALVTALPWIWSMYPEKSPLPPQIQALQVPGKTTIVTFTDFECPHCRNLHNKVLKQLEHDPNVKIQRVMVPLEFHRGALPAALAHTCAPEEKKDAVADALYNAAPEQLGYDGVLDILASVGVDNKADMRRCMSLEETKSRVSAEKELFFFELGGTGIPSTWVGNTLVKGADVARVERAFRRAGSVALPVWSMFVVAAAAVLAALVYAERRFRGEARPERAAAVPVHETKKVEHEEPAEGAAESSDEAPPPRKEKKKKRR